MKIAQRKIALLVQVYRDGLASPTLDEFGRGWDAAAKLGLETLGALPVAPRTEKLIPKKKAAGGRR